MPDRRRRKEKPRGTQSEQTESRRDTSETRRDVRERDSSRQRDCSERDLSRQRGQDKRDSSRQRDCSERDLPLQRGQDKRDHIFNDRTSSTSIRPRSASCSNVFLQSTTQHLPTPVMNLPLEGLEARIEKSLADLKRSVDRQMEDTVTSLAKVTTAIHNQIKNVSQSLSGILISTHCSDVRYTDIGVNREMKITTRDDIEDSQDLPRKRKREHTSEPEVAKETLDKSWDERLPSRMSFGDDGEKRSWKQERHGRDIERKRWERVNFPNLDYKLTKDSDYALWRDRIISEIKAQDCGIFVANDQSALKDMDPDTLLVVSEKVRCFIIRHLDDIHHKLVQGAAEPSAVLKKLDQIGAPEGQFTEVTAMARLSTIRYDPAKEGCSEFLARFEMAVRKVRRFNDLSDRLEKVYLLVATGGIPSVQEANRTRNLSLTEIKEFILNLEIDKRDVEQVFNQGKESALYTGHTPKRYVKSAKRRLGKTQEPPVEEIECYRCGQLGHYKENCKSKILCYSCNQYGNHYADNCPKSRKQKGSGAPKKQTTSITEQQKDKGGKSATPFLKVPLVTAQQMDKRRAAKGKAALAFTNDTDTESLSPDERFLRIDLDHLEPEEVSFMQHMSSFYANAGGDSDDSGENPRAYTTMSSEFPRVKFILDTGSTDHLVNDIRCFVNLTNLPLPRRISCANGDADADLRITKVGDVVLGNEDDQSVVVLKNVLYAPNLIENLFSLRRVASNGVIAHFYSDKVYLLESRSNSVLKKGRFHGRFWWLEFSLPLAGKSESDIREFLSNVSGLHLGGRTVKRKANPVANVTVGGSSPKKPRTDTSSETRPSGAETGGSSSSNAPSSHSLRDDLSLLWHLRLNHASKGYLDYLSKSSPDLKGIKFNNSIMDCSHCKLAKAKHQPCTETRKRAEIVFQRIYTDLMGPVKPHALATNEKYIVTFSDDASRYAAAYPLKDKTQVDGALKEFILYIRSIKGPETRICEIRTDGGLEFQTKSMKSLLSEEKIRLTISEPATPQHNAPSERLNREIQEKIRVNLISAKMPNYYWTYALRHSLFIHNRTPNASNEFKSPYELVYGRAPNLKYVRRFGCEAYVLHKHPKSLPKFEARSKMAFLLECKETGYSFVLAESKIIVQSKHAEFIESRVFGDHFGPDSYLTWHANLRFNENEIDVENRSSEDRFQSRVPSGSSTTSNMPDVEPAQREIIGETREAEFYIGNENGSQEEPDGISCLSETQTPGEPRTYREAMESPEREKWIMAVREEYEAHEKCQTWELIPKKLVKGKEKIIKARWVNKVKSEADGTKRYRSRLVAKGFADPNEYEMAEIYAPVARLPDVRFLLIMANKFDMNLTQFDVKTAFLNGSIEKPVYMEVPEGLRDYLGENANFEREYVCALKRALYGLKVSPKRWFLRFQEAVHKMGFESYEFQACLFMWRDNDEVAIMLLYVDDILLATNSNEKQREVTNTLKKEFEIKEMGEPKKFLGLEIERDLEKRTIFIHQKSYAEDIIKRFDLGKPKDAVIPMLPTIFPSKTQATQDPSTLPYRQALGALMYLHNGSRPDITFAVNHWCRRQANYDESDWKQVQRILRYVRGTADCGIIIRGETDTIDCYPDASLGLNDPQGQSTSGYVIQIFGDPVVWRTKKQNHVALSSAECEYVSMSVACRELANVREMARKLMLLEITPVIHEDNSAAIKLAETEESKTLKHLVHLCYHYVRREVKSENVKIQWISTEDQLGDLFTKALPEKKFLKFRDQLIHDPKRNRQ